MVILLALVVLILGEISLYVVIGGLIGLWATLAVVVVTGVAGVLILRFQGRHMVGGLVDTALDRRNPLGRMADGMLLALAGVLLILPGFLTDAAGLILLIPQVRGWIVARMAERARMASVDMAVDAMMHGRPHPRGSGGVQPDMAHEGDVIDAVAEEVGSQPKASGHPPSGWVR